MLRGSDHFVGCYNRERNTLSGIASFCKMLGKNHLDCYNILFFTYDGSRNFNVNAFDAAMVETSVYPIQSLRYQVVPYITAFHIMGIMICCRILPLWYDFSLLSSLR